MISINRGIFHSWNRVFVHDCATSVVTHIDLAMKRVICASLICNELCIVGVMDVNSSYVVACCLFCEGLKCS